MYSLSLSSVEVFVLLLRLCPLVFAVSLAQHYNTQSREQKIFRSIYIPVPYVLLTSRPIGTYADIKPEGERFISAYVPSTDVM